MLERIVGPALHTHLRVLHAAGDSELQILLVSRHSVHESGILAAERSAHCVTDVVAERSDLVEHVCIRLEGYLLCRICGRLCSPSLAVDDDIRIDGMETLADEVHGLDVMDGHEVEAVAVDVIFLHPPLKGLDHILAEHLLFGSGLVAAA